MLHAIPACFCVCVVSRVSHRVASMAEKDARVAQEYLEMHERLQDWMRVSTELCLHTCTCTCMLMCVCMCMYRNMYTDHALIAAYMLCTSTWA